MMGFRGASGDSHYFLPLRFLGRPIHPRACRLHNPP